MRHAMGPYERRIAPRKLQLFAGLTGTVLEIGCGVGANRRFLGTGVCWLGLDPNPHMRPASCAAAEALPLRDASVDAVLGTLVLCSVSSPERALAEVRRVLKPEGRFLFIEHVASPRGTAGHFGQQLLRPVCHLCAGGCHPLRDTGHTIQQAGFAHVKVERFTLGLPHILGVATR